MKRYVSGFLFFVCLTVVALLGLFFMTRTSDTEDMKLVQAVETVESPGFAEGESEHERDIKVHVVLNQDHVTAQTEEHSYCLVAEEGYLIVYDKKEETVNLFTHMPLAEFPAKEQERLLAGIWFPTMAEIFSYLESYSS